MTEHESKALFFLGLAISHMNKPHEGRIESTVDAVFSALRCAEKELDAQRGVEGISSVMKLKLVKTEEE